MSPDALHDLVFLATFISDGGGAESVRAADHRLLTGETERWDVDETRDEVEQIIRANKFVRVGPLIDQTGS